MSTATVPRNASPQPRAAHHELRAELRHVRDLVFVRDLLRERGAAPAELREYEAVIGEARAELAATARRVSTQYAAAA